MYSNLNKVSTGVAGIVARQLQGPGTGTVTDLFTVVQTGQRVNGDP